MFLITEQSLVSMNVVLLTNKSQKLNTCLTKNKVEEVYIFSVLDVNNVHMNKYMLIALLWMQSYKCNLVKNYKQKDIILSYFWSGIHS